MNTKNRLIEQLLRVAKKHKILTYPVLALVALISIFSYFFNWSTGAGKRVVAIIMVMVMLVSQSYFLTSSATEVSDADNDALALFQTDSNETSGDETPGEKTPDEGNSLIDDSVVTEGSSDDDASSETDGEENPDGQGTAGDMETTEPSEQEDPTQTLPAPGNEGVPVIPVPADEEDESEYDIMPISGETFIAIAKIGNDAPQPIEMICVDANHKKYKLTSDGLRSLKTLFDSANNGYYKCVGWYYNGELIPDEELAEYDQFTKDSEDQIRLTATKTLEKYKVTIKKGDNEDGVPVSYDDITIYTSEGTNLQTANGDSVDIDVPVVDGKGHFVINNPTKERYDAAGATILENKEGTVSVTSEGNLDITFGDDSSYARTVVLNLWKGGLYQFYYSRSEKNTDDKVIALAHYKNENDVWQFPKDLFEDGHVEPKIGYTFDYWTDATGTWELVPGNHIVDAGDEVQNYLFDQKGAAILYPHYKYNKINILENGTLVTGDEKFIDISYEYMDPEEEQKKKVISTKYQNNPENEEGKFEYTVVEGAEEANAIGITFETEGNTLVVRAKNGPTAITKNGPIIVKCQVKDLNANDGDGVVDFTFRITVEPQTIKSVDRTRVGKVYDGTPDLNINNLKDGGLLKTDVEHIFIDLSKATGCRYDSKNVSEDRVIYISGDAPLVSDDETTVKAENYRLPKDGNELVINGIIEPRQLYVTTKKISYLYGERGFVRAGEYHNPSVEVELDDYTNGTSLDYGLLDGDTLSSIVDPYYVDQFNQERDDDSLPIEEEERIEKTYYVEARALVTSNKDDACNNYEVRVKPENRGQFTFVLEIPEENTNYIFADDSNKQIFLDDADNLWLSGAKGSKILPYGEYDQIRTGGNGTWLKEIPLNETDNGNLTIQLGDHLNEQDTAFTSLMTIHVKVDSTAPDFQWVKVSQEGTSNPGDGFYFPAENSDVSFGNYYNNTIHITVAYKDTLSGPRYLHYMFKDGNLDSTTILPTFGETNDEGIATATFEIPVDAIDKFGYIDVCAEDLAGNVSGYTHLSRKGEGELEWAVEKSKPGITTDSFYVESTPPAPKWGTRPVFNGETKPPVYYSNCTAYISATDDTSGIYGVSWYVTGDGKEKIITDRTDPAGKQKAASFSLDFKNNSAIPTSKSGLYTLYATVRDNAGNVSDRQGPYTFYVDDVAPVIVLEDDYNNISAPQLTVKFYTYDELSGIESVDIYKDGVFYERGLIGDGSEESEGNTLHYYHINVTEAGNYMIVVTDQAGNVATKEINLGGISSDMPECPKVAFDPEANEKGWITSKDAVAQLENVRYTRNNEIGAATYYELWKDNRLMKADHLLPIETSRDVNIPEGIYRLHVWSQSYTGVQCFGAQTDSHFHDLYVDGTAPKIEYQLQRGSDNSVTVTFTITDAVAGVDQVSGVDKDTIKVLHGKEPVLISIEELESGDGYTGTFKVTENGTYTIQAADVAGNVADEEAFSPMSMKLNAVKNLTDSSVTVGAKIYKGTYNIKTASIAYRKSTDTDYTQSDAMPVSDNAGNMSISAVLTGLAAGTDYVYKITAVSEGNEVLEYEGYFRTLSDADVGVTITGVARYADNRDGFITVGLIKGNNNIRAVEMEVGAEKNNIFTFTKVPDGSYNLVATDGDYIKSIRVLIEGNKIIYPEEGISLILSRQPSTSVDIETNDTPNVSAEFNWMENLLTDEDYELIESGGTVEYQLNAKMIRITNIDTAALSAMYAVAGTDKVVGAYLDLTLYKIVTDEDGNVTKKPVSELLGGASVSVTIPLGDMTGKSGLMVVRIHQAGSTYTGRYLPDQDINPSTYTVTTSQFSTYAVLYDKNQDNQLGDDTVTGTPNRGDNVINGSYKPSVKKDVSAVEMAAVKVSANDDDTDNKTNTNTSSKNSVGSLRSASTAKTGDEAPIVLAGIMMMFAMGGFVVLRRKANKN